jgi:hypothetical protein
VQRCGGIRFRFFWGVKFQKTNHREGEKFERDSLFVNEWKRAFFSFAEEEKKIETKRNEFFRLRSGLWFKTGFGVIDKQ